MTSLIPKVKVGVANKKTPKNVSCMVHGTSEIGFVLPTYCRNFINDADITLNTRTGVRLSSMFVPTMGKLDVRHYHTFVPFNRCWAPYDAFIARESYNWSDRSVAPSNVPYFRTGDLIVGLLNRDSFLPNTTIRSSEQFSDVINFLRSNMLSKYVTMSLYRQTSLGQYEQVSFETTYNDPEVLQMLTAFLWPGQIFTNQQLGYTGVGGFVPATICDDKFIYFIDCERDSEQPGYFQINQLTNLNPVTGLDALGVKYPDIADYLNSLSFPSIEHCDFSWQFTLENLDKYFVCFNFNGPLKRLRSIFMGLGYSFNIADKEPDSILKLLAYYRSYFSLFGLTRDYNFNDTACGKLSRLLDSEYSLTQVPLRCFLPGQNQSSYSVNCLYDFLKDLCDTPYYCPSDYFSSAVQNTQQGITGSISISDGSPSNGGTAVASASRTPSVSVTGGNVSILAMQVARKVLSMVNVSTVAGRKIADILHARYGDIEVDDSSSEGVYRLGGDTTPIEIGIIFNQTSSDSAPLGEFAGVGSGGSKSETHHFNTPSFGCMITLTAVVPEMGYFQGKLRENSDGVLDVLEIPDEHYDALGWQSVRYNELVADRCFGDPNTSNMFGTSLGVYGYQTRYAHMKVGFNRVLGDISLPHMIDSMLPYTLDRYFNPRLSLPANTPYYSKRGDIGDTNRIFEVTSPTDDHIIYQIYFDVEVNDRLKPLSTSYDTILAEDTHTIELEHQ